MSDLIQIKSKAGAALFECHAATVSAAAQIAVKAQVNLRNASLSNANLSGADLNNADLSNANLLCLGDLKYIRTMQFDRWMIGYTATDLQIGCQRHPIDKWRMWNTEAGRKWVGSMDAGALEWADRNLALVLSIIDANPAKGGNHE